MPSSQIEYNLYGMVPSFSANLTALILFAILWAAQTVLGVIYRQWWFGIAFFIGCGLETAGYIGRTLSSQNVFLIDPFLLQIICLTLAPAFIMGGVYALLGKLVVIFGQEYSRLKPLQYSYIFVVCDLVSIVLQAIGGGMTATALRKGKNTHTGTHIMVGGLASQVFSMGLFMLLFGEFMYKCYKHRQFGSGAQSNLDVDSPSSTLEKQSEDPVIEYQDPLQLEYARMRQSKSMKYLIIAICICVLTIFTRCVYRVVELSEGWTGHLIIHEPYFLVLDALMVFIGSFSLTVIYPGFVFHRVSIHLRSEIPVGACEPAEPTNAE